MRGKKTKKTKASRRTRDPMSRASEVVDYLDEQGCISKDLLQRRVLTAIGQLSADDARALARVNRSVPLNLFFKSRGPQEGR